MADQLWCCECYRDDGIAVPATYKVFNDDVCKRHFDILSKEIADIQESRESESNPNRNRKTNRTEGTCDATRTSNNQTSMRPRRLLYAYRGQ